MQFSAKLFLENSGNYVLGPGRIELLRSIAELGSLRKAAQKQGMSYRWAWGRLRDAEKALGIALLTGDSSGKAKILTPEALELLTWFEQTEKAVAGVLAQADAERPGFLD
ncbi:MAG: LysR family transcriptional regulator [Deltaproteobacteria bacterium]|jgi:molybdate transport system regulatory protein|nr:LysR family transcriptional regulator [Deltaproteobacteria bacterium]